MREALSRLVADGLVQASDQRGFRVSPVSAADLRDVTQTRVDIEGLALRRSIEHGIRLGSLRWSELLQRSEKARNVQAEHAAIVHAVLKRDADAAVVALSKHFLMTMHLVELATPKPPHSAASNDLHPLCQQPGRL